MLAEYANELVCNYLNAVSPANVRVALLVSLACVARSVAVQLYEPSSPACVGLMVRPAREMVILLDGVITAVPFLHTMERELDEVAWQLN